MEKALQRHAANQARILPIILRPVYWEDAPFAHLQVLPIEAKPATRWSTPDDAFEDVTRGVRKVVQDLRTMRKTKEEWLEEGNTFYYLGKALAFNQLNRHQKAQLAFDKAKQLRSSK